MTSTVRVKVASYYSHSVTCIFFAISEKRKDKKKRKKPAKIVSFDADDSSYSGSPMSSIASPLSKSSSFDLSSPVPVSMNSQPRTGFVFPSLAVEPSKSDPGGKSDTESEKSAKLDDFALREEALKIDEDTNAEMPETEGLNQQRKQKFPGVNDGLGTSGIKTWQDVLGIDSVTDSRKRETEVLDITAKEGLKTVTSEVKDKTTVDSKPQLTELKENDVDSKSKNISADTLERKQESSSDLSKLSMDDDTQNTSDNQSNTRLSTKPETISCPNQTSTETGILQNLSTEAISMHSTAGKKTVQDLMNTITKETMGMTPSPAVTSQMTGSEENTVTVTHTPAATIKMAGAIEAQPKTPASTPTLHGVKSTPAFSPPTDTVPQTKASLPGVKSLPVIVDPENDPSRVRTLPSGNSVDNADTQSNFSFGSVSSSGEAFSG